MSQKNKYNYGNDKYRIFDISSGTSESHILKYLKRDFGINSITSWRDSSGISYDIYDNNDKLQKAIELLDYYAPALDKCVMIEKKEYLTDGDIEKAVAHVDEA